ncbi:putative pectin lyase A [Aspergillus coremiiformis]|uniref:pectin lyase n=1 Tax=Aspergillus coremiiformis TaxID=138285 RepID=A0A5N6ZFW4_9EURO|nr:putative pectin lyase A [Aspergillus coremiiformis]
MQFFLLSTVLAGFTPLASAISVSGAAEGFAETVTGGGAAAPVHPKTPSELVAFLGDPSPQVIVLEGTIDFTKTEGEATETGCAPWGTESGCQLAINQDDWCTNYQGNAPAAPVTYDKAGLSGIAITSDKTLLGSGPEAVIKGKGLRIVNAKNVIIQNVAITDINAQYVWGGDAITIDEADLVWIDHVTTARIGRQHLVHGTGAGNRVTISNSHFDGVSDFSATCNGYAYWGLYFAGSNDQITFKRNYIHNFSGRSPKVQGGTLLHAVNNFWADSTGHAFEIGTGGSVLAEGNVFQNIATPAQEPIEGELFTAPDATANAGCAAHLGRDCQANVFENSGLFTQADTGFLPKFGGGGTIALADPASAIQSVPDEAGQGKI